jgi:hypothetical protein
MKSLAKIVLVAAIAGAGATMYAAPGAPGISSQAMLGQVTAIRAQITTDLNRVMQLQARARRDKDLIKLNCLNDKLVQMKPEVNIAERAQADIQAAHGDSDAQVAFATLSNAGTEVNALRESAEQCIGKPLLGTESSNEYTHPVIDENPTTDVNTFGIEPPAYASPFN